MIIAEGLRHFLLFTALSVESEMLINPRFVDEISRVDKSWAELTTLFPILNHWTRNSLYKCPRTDSVKIFEEIHILEHLRWGWSTGIVEHKGVRVGSETVAELRKPPRKGTNYYRTSPRCAGSK